MDTYGPDPAYTPPFIQAQRPAALLGVEHAVVAVRHARDDTVPGGGWAPTGENDVLAQGCSVLRVCARTRWVWFCSSRCWLFTSLRSSILLARRAGCRGSSSRFSREDGNQFPQYVAAFAVFCFLEYGVHIVLDRFPRVPRTSGHEMGVCRHCRLANGTAAIGIRQVQRFGHPLHRFQPFFSSPSSLDEMAMDPGCGPGGHPAILDHDPLDRPYCPDS